MEKMEKTAPHILDEISLGLPPLERACRLIEKTTQLGWAWRTHSDAASKVQEELGEAEEAAGQAAFGQESREHLVEECGDVIFSALSYVMTLGIAPAEALDRANRKFCRRFNYIEEKMQEKGLPLDGSHVEEESILWQEAKKAGL